MQISGNIKKWLPRAFVAAVGVLFGASGVLKMLSMEAFELYIFGFGLLSWDLATVLARLVIAAELTLGVAYIAGFGYRFFRWAGLALLLVFTLFLIPTAILYPDGNCHCFGESLDIKPLPSIAKNILLALPLVFVRRLEGPLGRLTTRLAALVSTATAIAAVVTVFAISPPDFFFKKKDAPLDREAFTEYMQAPPADIPTDSPTAAPETGTQPVAAPDSLPVIAAPAASAPPELVCFYSTFCRHCQLFARKVESMCDRYGVPPERVRIVFMDLGDNIDTEARKFLTETGSSPGRTYNLLDPRTLLSITVGEIPCAVLVVNGEIRGVYNYINFDKSVIDILNGQ